jgi:hypothetical protein
MLIPSLTMKMIFFAEGERFDWGNHQEIGSQLELEVGWKPVPEPAKPKPTTLKEECRKKSLRFMFELKVGVVPTNGDESIHFSDFEIPLNHPAAFRSCFVRGHERRQPLVDSKREFPSMRVPNYHTRNP